MSWLSSHVFDPIKAAIARAQTSSNPTAAAVGAAADKAYTQIAGTVTMGVAASVNTSSAAALASGTIADLESGLQGVVDAFILASLGSAGPVGAALAPEAVSGANVLLTFAEQHAMTFIASLFHHAKAQVGPPA